jgi:hypothetical protein
MLKQPPIRTMNTMRLTRIPSLFAATLAAILAVADASAVNLLPFNTGTFFLTEGEFSSPTIPMPLTVSVDQPVGTDTFIVITSSNPTSLTVVGGGATIPAGQTSAVVLCDGISQSASVEVTAYYNGAQTVGTIRVLNPAGPAVIPVGSEVLSTIAENGMRRVQLTTYLLSRGAATTVTFEYGMSADYAGSVAVNVPAGGSRPSYQSATIDVSPGFTWHWRVSADNGSGSMTGPDRTFSLGSLSPVIEGDLDNNGVVSQSELDTIYANYVVNSPWLQMTNVAGLGGTTVSFSLDNSVSGAYTVQYSTNLVDWFTLGTATPRYIFNDADAPAEPQRYYRLAYP